MKKISTNATAVLVAAIVTLFAAVSSAAAGSTVSGSVKAPNGSVVDDARVILVELGRSTFVDEDGTFRFADVPDGSYHLRALSGRFGGKVEEIDVAGSDVSLVIELDLSQHRERIVVTATRSGQGSAEVVSPVTVLDSTELSDRAAATLGDTLAGEPGLRSTAFGPGAGRPIIRGQTAGRVRVLEGGLGVGDASVTSPDHAVSTDVLAADQIEVVRGPATLLYGSTAVGGVVNVIDERVPTHIPQKPIGGRLDLRYGSAAEEQAASLELSGGGGGFAWHLDGLTRETEDFEIPGRGVENDPESPEGILRNSAVETDSFTAGVSTVGDWGYAGVSFRMFDTLYGIPAELEEEEEVLLRGLPVEGEEGIKIDLEQQRFDLRSSFRLGDNLFNSLDVRYGVTDYEHRELEGAEVGTEFFTDTRDLRVELKHGEGDALSGVVGLQLTERELEAIGAEAFLPASETENIALFTLERLERGDLHYEFGLRLENQDVSTSATAPAEAECAPPRGRSFDTVSGSFGVVWLAGSDFAVGASLARAVRGPGAEELYSCGPHVATLSFEIGDPDLEEETSYGLDISLRKRTGRLTGELNLFSNRYNDYIFEVPTGEVGDGLPVFQFTQADARFFGLELSALYELFHTDEHDLDLELIGDTVRGELRGGGDLPRIPPTSVGVGLRYRGPRLYGRAHVRRYGDQNRVFVGETATEGYTLVSAAVGYRVPSGRLVHDVSIQAQNLTDEEARVHTSRLKDFVQLTGRDIRVIYRMLF